MNCIIKFFQSQVSVSIFYFPICFLTYQKDFELQVKFKFIQSYRTENLKKTFYSNQILDEYQHANNKNRHNLSN